MTELVKAVLNGEHEIILPKHRADRPDWYTAEGWERRRLRELKSIIQSQDKPVVYYAGAEEGEMPALCQIWGAEVVMFEPNPKVWPNIKAIWEANDLDDPAGVFVGFAAATTMLYPPYPQEEHRASLGMWPRGERAWPPCASGPVIGDHGFRELVYEFDAFPCIAMDDVATAPPPTVITFDCEGSDWEVCKGAEKSIIAHRPHIVASIHPEFMFHQFGQYSRDFRYWIKDFGYDEDILEYEHELHVLYTPRAG